MPLTAGIADTMCLNVDSRFSPCGCGNFTYHVSGRGQSAETLALQQTHKGLKLIAH